MKWSSTETKRAESPLLSLSDIKGELEEVAIIPEVTEEINLIIPAKSSQAYQSCYNRFIEWCKTKGIRVYSEEVLLEYFSELGAKSKCTSMWTRYSMLKSLLIARNGVDISNFLRLKAFLKQQNEGYTPTKTRALTKNEFEQFLLEASDEKYLAMKVVMIFGISGGCRREELINLKVEDIEDLGSLIHIKIPDNLTKHIRSSIISRADFIHYYRKYAALRPPDMETNRFFLQYIQGKCTRQVMGINKIGSIPKMIANYLKLPHWKEYTGHCFRKISSAYLESEKRQRNPLGYF